MRGAWSDYRLVIPVLYLMILGTIGGLSDFVACNDCLISFGPEQASANVRPYSPPGYIEIDPDGDAKKHYLGTDQLGRDVAARLVHGIPVAYKVGIWSSIIALLIALVLGSISGWVGDRKHQVNVFQLIMWLILGVVIHHLALEFSYYEDDYGRYTSSLGVYIIVMMAGLMIGVLISQRALGRIKIGRFWMPWDLAVVKVIEVFNSVPRLFFLLAIFAIIARPSVLAVIVVIGLIRWPSLTRLVRAEIIKVKNEDFVKGAMVLGLPTTGVLIKHVLPNIYKPIIVLTAINMGSAVLIESSLSFLGIGLPLGEVSWGRMLGDARHYIRAWWIALGPGFLIFSMILCFNLIGDRLSYFFKVDQ